MAKNRTNLYIIFSFLLFFSLLGCTYLQGQDMVYLEQCTSLSYDENINSEAQILKGNVRFRHDSALMFCDSAYFYEKNNSLDAFGNVKLIQGDTITGFADAMYYDGNTKVAQFKNNVKLIHRATVLTTDSLDYDRKADIAYYYEGGKIVDSLNTLQSIIGKYFINLSIIEFYEKVILEHPHFILKTDTLVYNTDNNIASIKSATRITYSHETDIYSKNGWYNTANEHSKLFDNSYIVHSDGKYLTGDTIFYDKQNKYGKVFGNMQLVDSNQHITLYGQYGEVYEKDEKGFATQKAYVKDWSDTSKYAYLHADTIFTENRKFPLDSISDTLIIDKKIIKDTTIIKDSSVLIIDSVLNDSLIYPNNLSNIDSADRIIKTDTAFLLVRAYHNVRFYREDLQGKCDSLVYDRKDSVIRLFFNPVCWSDSSQLIADTIILHTGNNGITAIEGHQHAMGIERLNIAYFNQICGKNVYVRIDSNKVKNIEVVGNVETIYYPKDENAIRDDYIGMNRLMCSFVNIFVENNEIHHILFLTKPVAVMYPLDQIPSGEDKLAGFFWNLVQRPRCWQDIFKHPKQEEGPQIKMKSATTAKTQEELEKEKKHKEAVSRKRNKLR